MLSTSAFRAIAGASRRRTFVSTVLLTRSWENDTVVTLRQEAKVRGLSQKGNKATLITRLQEYDHQNPMQHVSPHVSMPTPPTQQTRLSSTTEVPGVPSSAEPHLPPHAFPQITLDVIPDAAQPVPLPSVQIPFVPDFWDSSRVKAAEQAAAGVEDSEISSPSVIAVAGDTTIISASPSHNIYTGGLPESSTPEAPKLAEDKSFLQDLADDLFIPTSWPKIQTEGVDLSTSTPRPKTFSRTLDREEKQGLWYLLGIFVGSFALAGVLQAPSKFASRAEEAAEEAAAAPKPAH